MSHKSKGAVSPPWRAVQLLLLELMGEVNDLVRIGVFANVVSAGLSWKEFRIGLEQRRM